MNNKTFEECTEDEIGTVYYEWEEEGYKVLIMRGPASINGYIGVPQNHVFWDKGCDDLDIDCHGGLTFSHMGSKDDDKWILGWYWFGWDYAHHGDKCFYDLDGGQHGWTPYEVRNEAIDVLEQFKNANKKSI